jgi:hypothetical protein
MDDLGPAVVSVTWIFALFALAIISARFYVRLSIIKRLTVDDYVILITLVILKAVQNHILITYYAAIQLIGLRMSVKLTISTHWGLGKHVEALKSHPERIIYAVKSMYISEFFTIMAPGFGRISFALLLIALVPYSETRRRFLWFVVTIQFIADIATVIISFSQCRPIQGFWDSNMKADFWSPYVQEYVGFAQGSKYFDFFSRCWHGSSNVAVCSAVDLTLALFPVTLFWNMNKRWKCRLMAYRSLKHRWPVLHTP